MDSTSEIKPINPIDPYLHVIAQAVEEWRAQNTPEHIKDTVKKRLEEAKQQITLLLLGFEQGSFKPGSWSIDNCNGRAANTAVGRFLAEQQGLAIKEWLTTVCMPTVTPALQKRLLASAQQAYNDSLEVRIREFAREKAAADAKELVNSLVKSNQLQDYLRTLKLINME